MGTITEISTARAARITGTRDPTRLKIMVRLLELHPERNTADQSAKLAAAKRLLKEA